jgi:PQQ-dependent catabolism-associated CXXCW motif protein
MLRFGAYLLILAVTASVAAAAPAAQTGHVPEPKGYWLGPVHGPVPATITGGTVIDTVALARLLAHGRVVLLDVAEAPHRPAGLPAGTLWMAPLHRDIPGSVWMPGVGRGKIPPGFAIWFRTRLAALTDGDRNKRIVVYCHPKCWMSWNAAKRMIKDGYQAVSWYPDGFEGWLKSGHPTAVTKPQGPRRP